MRIETLATCHNRREMTLQALAGLHAQKLPEGVTMGHTVVDDGSSDGTSEAVKEAFPDVEIVLGDGGLFWAGGMRYGWNESVKDKSFDYLLVYNDDVRLHDDALTRLLRAGKSLLNDGGPKEHAVVGVFLDDEGNTSYGGVVHKSRWHPLRFRRVDPSAESYTLVDTMNMNACLISKQALEKAGFLCRHFVHSGADYDFGLRLKKMGGAVIQGPQYAGLCNRNDIDDAITNSTDSIRLQYKKLLGPKGEPFGQRMIYYARHGGVFWAVWLVSPYILLPFRVMMRR